MAGPRATIPPLAEASYVADRSTHLWVVGVFDRCDEREACLRWAQVVLRDGDDFRGGYVPAQHLAALDEWSGDPEALSVAVRPALLDAEVARYVVVARDRGGPPQAYEIEAPIAAGEGGAWPEIQTTVTGERVRVQAGATRITLDLSSDDELTPRSKRGR